MDTQMWYPDTTFGTSRTCGKLWISEYSSPDFAKLQNTLGTKFTHVAMRSPSNPPLFSSSTPNPELHLRCSVQQHSIGDQTALLHVESEKEPEQKGPLNVESS